MGSGCASGTALESHACGGRVALGLGLGMGTGVKVTPTVADEPCLMHEVSGAAARAPGRLSSANRSSLRGSSRWGEVSLLCVL